MRKLPTLVLACLGCIAYAKATRFEVKDLAFRNVLQWTSDAALEKTIAVSHFPHGWIELDPQNIKAGIKGEFEVDVRSFETGPDSKQVKIRDAVLGVAEYPGAFYKLDKLVEASSSELIAGKTVSARVSGVLSARGVSRRQEMQTRVTYYPESEFTQQRLSGNLIKIAAFFDLALNDFKAPIPEGMKALLAPVIKVAADMVGTDRLPVKAPGAPE